MRTTTGDNNSAYDPLSRLTNFRRGTLTSSGNNGTGLDTITTANLNSTTGVPNQNSWSLDALGNWTSGAGVSNTFNSQNEETGNGSNTLTYDNAGNMTTDQAGNLYTYDAWGHVVRIASPSNSTEETFSYDALGRAVVNNNGSGTENRYYSGTNIIQEQFSSTDYAQYVYGLAYVNDVILRDRNADGNNSTGNLGITGSGLEEREYAQHDTQFSVMSLTNASGTTIERFIYDPYGAITVLTPSWAYDTTGGGTNYWLYTFQGMRIVDAPGTSGMLFSETRIYDAGLGRWISQDGGYWDGANLDQAYGSNPVARTDPSGERFNYNGKEMAKILNNTPPPAPAPPRPAKQMCTDFFAPSSKLDNLLGGWFYHLFSSTPVSGVYVFAGKGGSVGSVGGQLGVGFTWDINNGYYIGGEAYGGAGYNNFGWLGGWYGYSQDGGWDGVPDPGSFGYFGGLGGPNGGGEFGISGDRASSYIGVNLGIFNFGFVVDNAKAKACCDKLIGAPVPVPPGSPPPPLPPIWRRPIFYSAGGGL